MNVIKCPRCDINFIRVEEGVCAICKREIKGQAHKEELPEMCIECGEHPSLPGDDLCIHCLKERIAAKDVIGDDDDGEVAEVTVDDTDLDLDDIEVSGKADIPDNELEEIQYELGIDEEIEDDEDDLEE